MGVSHKACAGPLHAATALGAGGAAAEHRGGPERGGARLELPQSPPLPPTLCCRWLPAPRCHA